MTRRVVVTRPAFDLGSVVRGRAVDVESLRPTSPSWTVTGVVVGVYPKLPAFASIALASGEQIDVRVSRVYDRWPRTAVVITGLCEWFAGCDNPADGTVAHPVLGPVLTCRPCAVKLDLTLTPATR